MILESKYKNLPLYAYNSHLATIIPSVFRKVNDVNFTRERLTLKDGDFIDIDAVYKNNRKLVILSHGLEGDTDKQYIKGAAKLFLEHNYDVIAWNCRSCSGEMNRAKRLYHHGEVGDIGELVDWIVTHKQYDTIGFIGFSMGGVINTKYVATQNSHLHKSVAFNIAISTPCDLEACALSLDQKVNIVYKKKFFNALKDKLILKSKQYPDLIDVPLLESLKTWSEFDEHFSARLNGFANRKEFYQQATLTNFLQDVTVPTLILNALNDPIVPYNAKLASIAKTSKYVQLEQPKYGGHCGYTVRNDYYTYSERSALKFALECE